jgi:hypothetical protein
LGAASARIINESRESFYKWLGKHHLKEDEIWIKTHKVDSGFKSITPKQAIARQKWLLRRGNYFLQNTLEKSVHGFVGPRCKLEESSVGKMRSYIARAS